VMLPFLFDYIAPKQADAVTGSVLNLP